MESIGLTAVKPPLPLTACVPLAAGHTRQTIAALPNGERAQTATETIDGHDWHGALCFSGHASAKAVQRMQNAQVDQVRMRAIIRHN